MEFDKSRILTVVTADNLKCKQKGWVHNSICLLRIEMNTYEPYPVFLSNDLELPFVSEGKSGMFFYPAPEPTPVFNSLKEYVLAELDWVEKNCVWAGAKVRVVSNFTNPNGWEGWINSDDYTFPSKLIGGEFVVRNVTPKGINLFHNCVRREDGEVKGWFTVPFYALEVIDPSKEIIINFCEYSCAMDSFRRYANGLEPQEPTYRPYNNDELNDLVGRVLIQNHTGNAMMAIKVCYGEVGKLISLGGSQKRNAQQLLDGWTHKNGEPCGVREDRR